MTETTPGGPAETPVRPERGPRPSTALWNAIREFRRDGRGQDAAALTYYAMLAFVPGLLAVVALIGLLGRYPETTDALLDAIARVGPDSAVETFRGTVEGIVTNRGGAGAIFGVGLVGAIGSATAWLDAFFRVADEIRGSRATDGFLRRKLVQVITAVGFGAGLAVLSVLVVVTGPIATKAGDAIGVGDEVVTAWSIFKWPAALGLAVTLVAALVRIAARSQPPPGRAIAAGAAVAVATWTVASAGFSLYVARFGSYNAAYGALGAVIVFLVWMWLTNAALIIGLVTATRLDVAPADPAGPGEPRAGGDVSDAVPKGT